jgi:parallel beta-helix repeat protein
MELLEGVGEEAPPDGICILGDVQPPPSEEAPPTVTDPVSGVRVVGLHIRNFPGLGIHMIGGEGARFVGNRLTDNGEYGIGVFLSRGTSMVGNRAIGAEEASIYVGDSPDAATSLRGNEVAGALFGIFIRNSEGFTVAANRAHGNCLGILFLGDAPGPAGDASVHANFVHDNNRFCPPVEEEGIPFPFTGTGVLLWGAHDVDVHGNVVTGNDAGDVETPIAGGVVVASGFGGTPSTGNAVTGNIIVHNAPDIRWDGAGTNQFARNVCDTSQPEGLCD